MLRKLHNYGKNYSRKRYKIASTIGIILLFRIMFCLWVVDFWPTTSVANSRNEICSCLLVITRTNWAWKISWQTGERAEHIQYQQSGRHVEEDVIDNSFDSEQGYGEIILIWFKSTRNKLREGNPWSFRTEDISLWTVKNLPLPAAVLVLYCVLYRPEQSGRGRIVM